MSGVSAAGLMIAVQPAAMRGCDLARRHGQREVPWSDEVRRPDRQVGDDHPARAFRVRAVVPGDAHRLFAEPAQELAAVADLATRLGERLAHLERHQQGEVFLALLQQVERAAQDLAANPRRGRRPGLLGVGSDIDRALRIGGGCIRNALEHLPGRRVGDVDAAPGGRVHPLAAEEQLAGHPREQLCFRG